MRYAIALCVILIKFEVSANKKCKDCVNISECPSISKYLNPNVPENAKKLREAYCGYDNQGVKICCSEFSSDEDEIEGHPNAGLLPENCGTVDGNRIIGGSIASLYEFPWMALISYKIGADVAFRCAGSIINSRYILTAAHCIDGQNIYGVRVGDFDIRYDYDCQSSPTGGAICESHYEDIAVEYAKPHEKYIGHPKFAFDIGLIRLQLPVNFKYKNIGPICLPLTKELRSASLANKVATVAGWGLTENQKESSVLLKVKIPIHPDETCFDFYSRILDPRQSSTGASQFCAGSYNKDTCNGDSGGPVIIEDKYKQISRFIQYGIVSQGVQVCGSGAPAVYTAVSKYLKWILDTIKP